MFYLGFALIATPNTMQIVKASIKYQPTKKFKKCMKIGQSTWVDRTFGNGVVSGMHSFHASAAAYTDYWNNAFGQVNLDHMATLS